MKLTVVAINIFTAFSTQAEVLVGTARNAEGDTLYIEKHDIERDESGFNKKIRVEYKKPDGQIFATMTSDFSKNKFIPDTVFEDKRFKTKSILRLVNDRIEFQEFVDEIVSTEKAVKVKPAMVASQGFDNFIRAQSKNLENSPQNFQFGVLSEQDFFSFTGHKKSSSSQDLFEYGIKAKSWIIRLFAEELRVIYDARTLRLKSFIGRSNILNDKGKSQDVAINYEWKEGP